MKQLASLVVAALAAGSLVTAARTQTLLSTPTLAPPMPQVIHPDSSGSQAVAHRTAGGTYAIQAEVDGAKLPMLFDTGASYVALRAEDAEKAGIDRGRAKTRLRSQADGEPRPPRPRTGCGGPGIQARMACISGPAPRIAITRFML